MNIELTEDEVRILRDLVSNEIDWAANVPAGDVPQLEALESIQEKLERDLKGDDTERLDPSLDDHGAPDSEGFGYE